MGGDAKNRYIKMDGYNINLNSGEDMTPYKGSTFSKTYLD